MAHAPYGVCFVDVHHHIAISLFQVYESVDRSYVTIHAVDAFGYNPYAGIRLFGTIALYKSLQMMAVIVSPPGVGCIAEFHAVDDAGMYELVSQYDVCSVCKSAYQPGIGVITRVE